MLETPTSPSLSNATDEPATRPFVYVSAEDIFRPFVPDGYIRTKRQAEEAVLALCADSALRARAAQEGKEQVVGDRAADGGAVRPVLVRPGLMYHPHDRPLTTPLAVLLDITSSLHSRMPFALPLPASPVPTSSRSPASRSSPLQALGAVGASLQVPPIHVDHVAECICRSIEDEQVHGVVDTKTMRQWVGLDPVVEQAMPAGYPSSEARLGGNPFAPGGQRRTIVTSASARPLAGARPESRGRQRGVTIYAPGPPGQEKEKEKDARYIIEPAGDAIRASSSSSSSASTSSSGNANRSPNYGATIDHHHQPGSQHPYASLSQFINEGGALAMDGVAVGSTPPPPPPPPTAGSAASITPDDNPTPEHLSLESPLNASSSSSSSAMPLSATTSPGLAIKQTNPQPEHPFDTHAFVQHMEKSGFDAGVARVLMVATKELIVQRSRGARALLLHKEDTENAAYLFKAALSELRTELSVKARNDGIALRSTASLIRREVDSLSQKLKEDIGTLKHDIEMDMNNRKAENRSDQKGYDIAIEEINNKFTISLGDLKTEIEQAKWDATRRAITIIAGVVFTVISVVTLSGSEPAAKPPASPTPSPTNGADVPLKAAMVNAGTSPRTPDEEALLRMSLGDLVESDETFPIGRDAMGNPYGGQYGRKDRI
ncbi:hypothetical protein QFC22_000522 [Naganishia vaughanmartiniae]|uniref:Uncharacterized protein n=1 Tax=Naganishia vaughanmartiniae TaxID=1424756 RepID=A0ACC2XNC2_9TREE|nr:hypothetical protein QFC22_000522 [Naganishia vaughanmartiniae]